MLLCEGLVSETGWSVRIGLAHGRIVDRPVGGFLHRGRHIFPRRHRDRRVLVAAKDLVGDR